jgi:hypothetical protein
MVGGEVRGAPGVGKSGIIRALAVQTAASSKIIFLSPQRTPRGWSALRHDLVREAADIPGFNVVVTGRETFGTDEPNWLPRDAIEKLGPTSVVIEEKLRLVDVRPLLRSIRLFPNALRRRASMRQQSRRQLPPMQQQSPLY